jgi:type II secretory pathway pseudopilin PulG
MSSIPHRTQSGVTYLALLLAIALLGTMLALAGTVWQNVQQREKERELLFVGDQFRQAIGNYYESTPGTAKQYPKKLEELLQDNRFPNTRRYLRQLYRDPMTGSKEWGLVTGPGNVIIGVHSLSNTAPLKTGNFAKRDEGLAGKSSYSDWQFVYVPQTTTGQPAPVPHTVPPGGTPAPNPNVLTPPGTVAPPPDKSATNEEQRRAQCEAVQHNDIAACESLVAKYGDDAAAICMESASVRFARCFTPDPAGGPLPPLDMGASK